METLNPASVEQALGYSNGTLRCLSLCLARLFGSLESSFGVMAIAALSGGSRTKGCNPLRTVNRRAVTGSGGKHVTCS